jgi:hypothetical protein
MTDNNRNPLEQPFDSARRPTQESDKPRGEAPSATKGPKVGEDLGRGLDTGAIQPGKTQGVNQA